MREGGKKGGRRIKTEKKIYKIKLTTNSTSFCRLYVLIPDDSIHTANEENKWGWSYSSVERRLDSHVGSASLEKQNIVSCYMRYCCKYTEWKNRDERWSSCRDDVIKIKTELEVDT